LSFLGHGVIALLNLIRLVYRANDIQTAPPLPHTSKTIPSNCLYKKTIKK